MVGAPPSNNGQMLIMLMLPVVRMRMRMMMRMMRRMMRMMMEATIGDDDEGMLSSSIVYSYRRRRKGEGGTRSTTGPSNPTIQLSS